VELSGSTKVVSLFDLVQILSVNGATGMLKVENEDDKGYVYFQDGQIINAMDSDHHEGEGAAKRVFSVKDADFSFSEDLPSVAKRISRSPQNLIMEIARQIDEESNGQDDESEVERVREVQTATAELNELVTRPDSETKILYRFHREFGILDCLSVIRKSSGTMLFLTAGARPELRSGTRMTPISEARLDEEGYQNLRARLLRGATPTVCAHEGEPEEFVLALGEDRFLVEAFPGGEAETLVVRQLPSPEELLETIPWPSELLHALLAEAGSVLLLVGPDGCSIERGFESACLHLIRAGWRPFVGMAKRWTPGIVDGHAGVMLRSGLRHEDVRRTESLIHRLDPAVVALDDSDCRDSLIQALRAWRRGARGLLGVCARSVSQAPRRLLDALDSRERSWLVQQLGMSLSGVLWVDADPRNSGKVWLVDEVTRVSLLDGDLSPLTRELAGKEIAELEAE
jgi:hypothetical protein